MELRHATKELHHRAEQHPIGSSMANGTMPEKWWVDWIHALKVIHEVIDENVPDSIKRVAELAADEKACTLEPIPTKVAAEYAESIRGKQDEIDAATYVLVGAHLMGGAITEKNIGHRLPCEHVRWKDRAQSTRDWKPLRDRSDLVDSANRTFAVLIDVMDEILEHRGNIQ